jgi:outer membrane receptor protein involved in Fe transport
MSACRFSTLFSFASTQHPIKGRRAPSIALGCKTKFIGVNNLPTAVGFFDYEPDTVTAYDVGSKNRFLDDRLQVQVWSRD